jgi:para-aminobenzoate synthetase component I
MAGCMDDCKKLMNRFGSDGEPFVFIIDYKMDHPEVYKMSELPGDIKFSTPLVTNYYPGQIYPKTFKWERKPVLYSRYEEAFNEVKKNISFGNSYLVNLTFPTEIFTDLTLEEIYAISVAKYRLLYRNEFLIFSPETFVRIENGAISTYPMKGTIEESVSDAENVILQDEKEMAEHNTVVDLLRNDLSMVADNVKVVRYRYIDRIVAGDKSILQVSSEITGRLDGNYRSMIGDIIFRILPAGSVTGAPKRETLRIIDSCEGDDRGWYTGIFGVFDGKSLDSCVMIRFIENSSGKLIFRSGGGITSLSNPLMEYNEMITKVYVPVG